jgi:hypothetical protein
MFMPARPTQSEHWIAQIFSARTAAQGGVVRRKATWVQREVGLDRLTEEVRVRGFHMVRSGDQYVIFCHPGAIQIIC